MVVGIEVHKRAHVAALLDERGGELVAFYGSHGIVVERVLTDNGTCFKRRWAEACAAHGIAVKKTGAYRPQTNGKACVSVLACRPVGRRGSVSQYWRAVRLDGEAPRSRRSDSGKRHVEEAL